MIIVNQAKDMIVNFNNLESIDIVVDLDGTGKLPHEIYYETNSKREKLGTYSTEERAKEVFNEIIKAYEKAGNLAFEINEDETEVKLTHNSNVFEMPEEWFYAKEIL